MNRNYKFRDGRAKLLDSATFVGGIKEDNDWKL
jgi:hypothetical protein